jgi:hypothetical protein
MGTLRPSALSRTPTASCQFCGQLRRFIAKDRAIREKHEQRLLADIDQADHHLLAVGTGPASR